MSYILDSLKRSDQERTRGAVPDLQSQPLISSAPPLKKPVNIRWLLLPLLLVIALYLGSLLLPPSESQTPPQKQAQTQIENQPQIAIQTQTHSQKELQKRTAGMTQGEIPVVTATPAADHLETLVNAPIPSVVSTTDLSRGDSEVVATPAPTLAAPAVAPFSSKMKVVQTSAPESEPAATNPQAVSVRPDMPNSGDALGISPATMSSLNGVRVKLQSDTGGAKTRPVPNSRSNPLPNPVASRPVSMPGSRGDQSRVDITEASSESAQQLFMPAATVVNTQPQTPPQAIASSRDPYEGISHIRQLPDSIKRALPELRFSVHIYSDHAASRMVKINGTTYREGAGVTRDLVLNEITRDGVVMTFKGERFWQLTR